MLQKIRHKIRIALGVTAFALAAASAIDTAEAGWFSWHAVTLYYIPL